MKPPSNFGIQAERTELYRHAGESAVKKSFLDLESGLG
jgi:hypothetical protein